MRLGILRNAATSLIVSYGLSHNFRSPALCVCSASVKTLRRYGKADCPLVCPSPDCCGCSARRQDEFGSMQVPCGSH